jgi:hypothetical protein
LIAFDTTPMRVKNTQLKNLKQDINKSATSSYLDTSRSNGGEPIAVAPLKTQLAAFNGQGIEFNHWISGDARM